MVKCWRPGLPDTRKQKICKKSEQTRVFAKEDLTQRGKKFMEAR